MTVQAYKIGFCPQCQCQIMVRDVHGHFTTMKTNYRQIDISLDDGHIVRVPVCSGCVSSANVSKIMQALTHNDSQASKSENVKQRLKFKKIISKENGIVKTQIVPRDAATGFAEFKLKKQS